MHPFAFWCPVHACPNSFALGPLATVIACRMYNLSAIYAVMGCGWHAGAYACRWARWKQKVQDDSETKNWLAANTKPCPKCGKPVEKNGGCNLVVCQCRQVRALTFWFLVCLAEVALQYRTSCPDACSTWTEVSDSLCLGRLSGSLTDLNWSWVVPFISEVLRE